MSSTYASLQLSYGLTIPAKLHAHDTQGGTEDGAW